MTLSRFRNAENGNVSVLFGLSVMPIALFLGGVTDIAQQGRHESLLQSALDASALAAARSLADDAVAGRGDRLDYQRAEKRARSIFDAAGLGDKAALAVSYEGAKVKLQAGWRMPANFLPLIGITELEVRGAAEADFEAVNETCVYVTAPQERGVDLHASSQLKAECNVRVESANSRAISATASSDMKAREICSNGETFVWATSTVEPAPMPCATPYVDPLRHLGPPARAVAPCDYRNLVVKGRGVQMRPGVYCGETSIRPASDVTLLPGEYVFRDGELAIGSGSSAKGEDVLLYFQGQSAGLHVGHGSRFDGEGRTGGAFAGVLVYTDRGCVDCANAIDAGGTAAFDGSIYAPAAPFTVASRASSITSAGALFVAHQLNLESSATVTIKASTTARPASLAAAESAIIRLVK